MNEKMIDPEFYDHKKDKIFHDEFLHLSGSEKDKIREKYKELRSKSLKLLNDDLRGRGHEGSIGGMDVYNDELWKYLDGEEKDLFHKYARILDFDWGFKPHKDDNQEGIVMRKSNRQNPIKIKRFKEIQESRLITEGLRFNTTYLSLPSGEYNIIDVLNEVRELEKDLLSWLKGGWQSITAVDKEHKEIIPRGSSTGLKNKK